MNFPLEILELNLVKENGKKIFGLEVALRA